MTPQTYLRTAIVPALSLLPPKMGTPEAVAMLIAIALEESGLRHRRQIGGPARSHLQFELGGLQGVLKHPASGPHAAAVIDSLDYSDCTPAELHAAMELDGVLACAMGRLLLYTDPHPLPARGQSAPVSWAYYWRNWRPGAFKDWTPDQAPPDKWAPYVATAWAALD